MGIVKIGNRNENIFNTLRWKKDYMLEEYGYEPMFVSLFGSQNYGLDNEKSDIDIRAIVFPTLNDLIFNEGVVSKVEKYGDGEVDIKDIKTYVGLLKRGNPTYIESLFSPYQINCLSGLEDAKAIVEEYSDVMVKDFMYSALGTISSKYKHMYKEDKKNEEHDYNGKDLSHMFRVYDLMNQVADGSNLAHLNFRTENRTLRGLALSSKEYRMTDELAKSHSKIIYDDSEKLLNNFVNDLENNPKRKKDMDEDFKNLVYNAIYGDIYRYWEQVC